MNANSIRRRVANAEAESGSQTCPGCQCRPPSADRPGRAGMRFYFDGEPPPAPTVCFYPDRCGFLVTRITEVIVEPDSRSAQ